MLVVIPNVSCFQGIIDGEGHRTDLVVVNQSDYDIYILEGGEKFDHFSIHCPPVKILRHSVTKGDFMRRNDTFETHFQYQDTIRFYIVEVSYADLHDGEKNYISNVRKNALMARYKFSYDDLVSLNWAISFPPDDRMQSMDIVFYEKWADTLITKY